MSFSVIPEAQLEWITRPHEPGEPARYVAELSEPYGFEYIQGNIWRYEPGAKGIRHRHKLQEEVFVVLAGTLSIYLGDPASRHDVPARGVVRVAPGTPLQSANHGEQELVVFACGYPPEHERSELLDSAV